MRLEGLMLKGVGVRVRVRLCAGSGGRSAKPSRVKNGKRFVLVRDIPDNVINSDQLEDRLLVLAGEFETRVA